MNRKLKPAEQANLLIRHNASVKTAHLFQQKKSDAKMREVVEA